MTDMELSVASPGEANVVVSTIESTSGLAIHVHPLVLLNISDHYTRLRVQMQDDNVDKVRIYGALLAKQTGREIDLVNSFELPLLTPEVNDTEQIDDTYLKKKLEQFKQVFPHLDFIGWYSIGSAPTQLDLKLHSQFSEMSESCLFLQLNPLALSGGIQDIPVWIFESTMSLVGQDTRLVFVKTPYKIETGEAERIAVEHVSKPSDANTESGLGNALLAHLTAQRNAIEMLHRRLQFLHTFLNDAKNGVIPLNHDIARQVSMLCRFSPIVDAKVLEEQFTIENNDVLLMAYLATITKGLNSMQELLDKIAVERGVTLLQQFKSVPGPSGHDASRPGRMGHCSSSP